MIEISVVKSDRRVGSPEKEKENDQGVTAKVRKGTIKITNLGKRCQLVVGEFLAFHPAPSLVQRMCLRSYGSTQSVPKG